MSTTTITNLLTITTLLGAVLVAQYVAGRLHARLAGEEATNLKLEFATIVAVFLYLLLQGAIAIALELPAAELNIEPILNRLAPPA